MNLSPFDIAQLPFWTGQEHAPTPSPLHVAAWDADLDRVRALVTGGADVNALDERRHPPLTVAICGAEEDDEQDVRQVRNRLAVVRYLIEAGADVDGGSHGISSIEAAVSVGVVPLIQCLVDAGASLAVEPYSQPLLHMATEHGRGDVVESLLTAGVPADSQDDCDGTTALHWAVRTHDRHMQLCFNPPAVRALIRAGASPSVRNHSGESPMDVALPEALAYIEECLVERQAQALREGLNLPAPPSSRRRL